MWLLEDKLDFTWSILATWELNLPQLATYNIILSFRFLQGRQRSEKMTNSGTISLHFHFRRHTTGITLCKLKLDVLLQVANNNCVLRVLETKFCFCFDNWTPLWILLQALFCKNCCVVGIESWKKYNFWEISTTRHIIWCLQSLIFGWTGKMRKLPTLTVLNLRFFDFFWVY
mgnify:CR=1 FL=1